MDVAFWENEGGLDINNVKESYAAEGVEWSGVEWQNMIQPQFAFVWKIQVCWGYKRRVCHQHTKRPQLYDRPRPLTGAGKKYVWTVMKGITFLLSGRRVYTVTVAILYSRHNFRHLLFSFPSNASSFSFSSSPLFMLLHTIKREHETIKHDRNLTQNTTTYTVFILTPLEKETTENTPPYMTRD